MEYNTQRKKMELPEYGRSVQNMVEHALTIENREERQLCAETIISIMGGMFPHLREVPDFKHKLWDHLAIMADFKLDIDYPFDVVKPESLNVKPEKIAYPIGEIRYRHYGRFLEEMVAKAVSLENKEEQAQLIRMLVVQMKKSYSNWNKEGVEGQKILDDLREYSNGAIDLTLEDLNLNAIFLPRSNNQQRKLQVAQRNLQPNNDPQT